jgi:O-acetyl-ADP-ribose deacetylase (regulator of RNase III)
MGKIDIVQGDLTQFQADAIVNAANNDLVLGGGLAGAIARRGGPEIQKECSEHGPVKVGQAAITGAGNLMARYVIHQASMAMGGKTSEQSLRDSTRAALRLAEDHGLRTIAFPATGTGIAGFDLQRCAQIMLKEVTKHLVGNSGLERVVFVLFDERSKNVFEEELSHQEQS